MKIGFLSADWVERQINGGSVMMSGGSGWYRCHVPAAAISKHTEHETVVVPSFAKVEGVGIVLREANGEEHPDCDIIVMQRVMNDYGIDFVDFAHRHGQIVVNDIDDWYWGLHRANLASKTTNPSYNKTSNRRHYKETILASDYVMCSTPFILERVNEWGVPCELLRNSIDIDRWSQVERDWEKPTVGWVGSTSHRSGDLETLKGIVGPFVERHDLKFHHSGHQNDWPLACDLIGVDRNRSTITPVCYIDEYPHQFDFVDLGLVPLNMIDFNYAKSYIKGLEYAAAGVPFVAQASPEYRLLEEMGIGITAKKAHHWAKKLESIMSPDVLQDEMLKNLDAVKAHSIDNMVWNWVGFFESIYS